MELDENHQTEDRSQELTQMAAKNGLIVGLISIVATYLLYLISTEALLGMPAIGIWLISIIIILYFVKQGRDLNGGYFTFGQAFKHTYTICLVAGALGVVFNYVLYNFLAPELAEETKRITIERTMDMMESFGAAGEGVDAAMEELEKQDYSMTLGKSALSLVYIAIGYGIFSVIAAAFMKKRKPEEF